MASSTSSIIITVTDIPKYNNNKLEIEKFTTDDIEFVANAFSEWLTYNVESIFNLKSDITNTYITITKYNQVENDLFSIQVEFKFNAKISLLRRISKSHIDKEDRYSLGSIISFFMKVHNGAIDQEHCKSAHELIETVLGGYVRMVETTTELPFTPNSVL